MQRRTQFAALALATLAVPVSCSSPPPDFEPRPTRLEVAHAAGAKLGGVAIGDVLPEHAGLEIVAVCVDGRVIVVYREQGRWRSQVAFQAPGELIQVAVGDLVPMLPGDEILAVGMSEGDEDSGGPGAVWLGTRHRDSGFQGRLLATPPALQHAAAIGDFDPDRPGLEALSSGFDRALHVFAIADDLTASETVRFDGDGSADLPGPAKGACIVDGSLYLACASGHLFRARGATSTDADAASGSVLSYTHGMARPAVRDGVVLSACDDGALLRTTLDAEREVDTDYEVIHREVEKLRGAAIGDFDGSRDGLDLATCGYAGFVSLVARDDDGAWTAIVLADTDDALHHLACGDVRPDVPGDELVAVGYAGKVYVLSR